jgi:hypothetical protein
MRVISVLQSLVRAALVAVMTLPMPKQTLASDPPLRYACVTPIEAPAVSRVLAMHDLPDGTVLIGTEKEWFRFKPADGSVLSAGNVETGRVLAMYDLPGDTVLIRADKGLFHFGPWQKSVEPADGTQIGRVLALHELPGGAVLVQAKNGWFRSYSAVPYLVPAGEALTGTVVAMYDLPGGAALIGADNGLFRFDPADERVTSVPTAETTGHVHAIHDLPREQLILIGADNGLFRFDTGSGHVTPVPVVGTATGRVLALHELPGGAVLIEAQNGLFRFDPGAGDVVPTGELAAGSVVAIHNLPSGAVLIQAKNGLYRLDPVTWHAAPAEDAKTGRVLALHDLPDGSVLIRTDNGLFLFDAAAEHVVPVGGVPMGDVLVTHSLRGGGVLIWAANGWFRFDPAAKNVVPVEDASSIDTVMLYRLSEDTVVGRKGSRWTIAGWSKWPISTDSWFDLHDLSDGTVLIRADSWSFSLAPASGEMPVGSSWFRFDPAGGRIVSAGAANLRRLLATHDLPDGGVLIQADTGFYRFDPMIEQVVPVPTGDTSTGSVFEIHSLPGGDILIGADEGLFKVPSRGLGDADVTFDANLRKVVLGSNWVDVRATLSHPCAPASGNLGLELSMTVDGASHGVVSVRLLPESRTSANLATLAAPIVFNEPGKWRLQLQQGQTSIGQSLLLSLPGRSFGENISSYWETALAVFTVLYLLAFSGLLLLTRRHAWAFRALSDSVWARFLTWPFFFLRHFPVVQQWVLESWYQAIRRGIQKDVRFLDPPISTTRDEQIEGAGLLDRLRDNPRLWLQGRSGMGKSSVFAAWERAYFAAIGAPTLSAAVRRYGFILITLPVRYYAALSPPEPNRPETWVLEAARRRLEQFGLAMPDLGLIDAMLKAGRIALAFDGTNEADRDAAIAAFAQQFPAVRLLVTSQGAAWSDWEAWHLPDNVSGLREGLLNLWLGAEKAALLSDRIVADGLTDSLLSGYDLRLVVDLAGADPEHLPLPPDRIGLYRAMLARDASADEHLIRLEGLKRLAWTMITQRRREIVSDDEKLLGSGTLKALAKEGIRIVWPVSAVHEFRHDQMRAFLAALWLIEETPNLSALEKAATDEGAFALNRRDQEELWRFVAALLVSADDLKALWRFANDDPELHALLLAALQAEADERDVTLVRTARRRGRVARVVEI